MIRTILAPIDGSAHAQMALEMSSSIAAKYDAQLIILHIGVGDEDVPEDLYNKAARELKDAERDGVETGIPPHQSQRLRVLGYMGKMLMREAREFAEKNGVQHVQTVIDLGDAADRILHHANTRSADLIVMGSRGFGELKSLMLGSVTHKVSNLSPCPCVTVHQKETASHPDRIKSILAPTDGSDQADKSVEFAIDIAEKYGARLVLLYVMWRGPSLEKFRGSIDMTLLSEKARDELDPGKHPIAENVSSTFFPPVISEATFREIGQQILDRGRQLAESRGVSDIELVLIDGDPARKILQIAKREESDLIVIGSRGLSGMDNILSGSVAYKVNHVAPCSCIIVR